MTTITLLSSLEAMPHIEYIISDICDELHLSGLTPSVTLAVAEAIRNAIVHANHGDISKSLTLSYGYSGGALCFDITDDGPGFDLDATMKNNLDLPSLQNGKGGGEGLFLMRSLADTLSYSIPTHTLHLEFAAQGINPTLATTRQSALARHYDTTLLSLDT